MPEGEAMRIITGLSTLALVFGMAVVTPLGYAQMGGGRGMRNYHPDTEVTLKGTVEAVNTVTGRRGWSATHLTFKSGENTYEVHLGPTAFLKQQGFEFVKGDGIEVTGSKVKLASGDTIIAREVMKDDQTLSLRDTQGIPKWSGRAMAQPGK